MDFKADPEYICLTVIRHGKCLSNVYPIYSPHDGDPDPLTEYGREQALNLAKELVDFRIDQLYSSPYERAVDTARALVETNNSHPLIDIMDVLKERLHGGEVTRLLRLGKDQLASYAQNGRSGNPPLRDWTPKDGGESLNDVAQRARSFLLDLLRSDRFQWKKGSLDISQWEAKRELCEPAYVPDGIPSIVIVSHNVFLTEMYEVLRDWNKNLSSHRWSSYHLNNAEWTRHIIERRSIGEKEVNSASPLVQLSKYSLRLYPLYDKYWESMSMTENLEEAM